MKKLTALILSALLVSCAKDNNSGLEEKRKLGTIAPNLNEEAKQSLEKENIAYQLIDKKRNLYFVEGYSAEDLKEILKGKQGSLIQNFRLIKPKKPSFNKSSFNQAPSNQQDKAEFPKCIKGADEPLAVLNTVNEKYSPRFVFDINKKQILEVDAKRSLNAAAAEAERNGNLGSLSLTGSKSSSLQERFMRIRLRNSGEEKIDERLSYYWVLQSDLFERIEKGPTYTAKLPVLGSYSLFLVVQDKLSQGCSIDLVSAKITDNPKPIENVLRPKLKEEQVENFVHLDKNKALKVRKTSTGKNRIIAVMDSGVNYNHPSLRSNVIINEKEIPNNGLDDDANGWVDDVVGYDFELDDGYAFDDEGHGSHVAGIAAGADIGIAPDAKILPIKMSTFKDFLQGMLYAEDMKVDVINMSFGFPSKVNQETRNLVLDSFESLNRAGIVVAVASGNDGLSIDGQEQIPTNVATENVIVVGALNEWNKLTSYSNYGEEVDVATHGGSKTLKVNSVSIYNDLGLHFIGMGGTSMAAPIVAGAVALVRELAPDTTAREVVEHILSTSQHNPELTDKVYGSKQLDIENMVSSLAPALVQP